jgi:hypothetical protein
MLRHISTFIMIVLLMVTLPAAAESLVHTWSHGYGDANYQDAVDIAVDPEGDIFLLGTNWGTIDYGGGPMVTSGSADVVVVKLDPNGNHLWSREFGDALWDHPSAIAILPNGNIAIVGSFEGGIDFGGGILTSAGSADAFLAVLDGNTGGHVWSRSFGSTGSQYLTTVAADASGSVYVAGYFEGTVNFGGGALTSAGDYDLCVAKFGGMGVHAWSFSRGDTGFQAAWDVAVHPAGMVVVTGEFQGAVNFGGGVLTSAGGADAYLAAYSSTGAHLWSRAFGDANGNYGRALAVDGAGDILMTGYYAGTIFTGGYMLTSTAALDIFLAKLDVSGALLMTHNIGGAGSQLATDIAVDSHGNILLTGEFYTEIDLGGGVLAGTGSSDIFLAKYGPAGTYLWGAAYGGSSSQYPGAVAVDGSRNVIMYAGTEQAINLGGGMLPHGGGGATDQVVAKYGLDPSPLVTAIADVHGDQGRKVRITFQASTKDVVGSLTPILQYEAFRRIDPGCRAASSEARSISGPPMSSDPVILAEGWEFVGAVPAHTEAVYNIIAPTLADSTADEGVRWSVFFLRAATALPGVFYDSPPDSGYSVDNLTPNVPEGFTVAYGPINSLNWMESRDQDFRYFKIYRGSTPGFTPDTADPLHVTIAIAWTDPAGGYEVYYKISAVDFAGNESDTADPESSTGVYATPTVLTLYQVVPNPFNPTTTIKYDVPVDGRVTLRIYDVRGALVRTLIDADLPRGTHQATWDGRDASGRGMASGSYFARLEAGGRGETVRMSLVR